MTFEEAIIKSIKSYWQSNDDFDQMQTSKNRKFNKKYFDGVESEFLNKEDNSDKKLKKELKNG